MSVVFSFLLLIFELIQQAVLMDFMLYLNFENLCVENFEEKAAYLLPSNLLK